MSLFVDANEEQISSAKKVGADIIELHTGEFCHKKGSAQKSELKAAPPLKVTNKGQKLHYAFVPFSTRFG